MTWGQEWEAAEAGRLAEHVRRTGDRLVSLERYYVRLFLDLVAGGGRGHDDERRRTGPGPRLPLRVDVLDLIEAVDHFAGQYGPLVRGTLRVGPAARYTDRSLLTRATLELMERGLGRVYSEDAQLGDDVARAAWQLERRAGLALGEVSRPFALADRCPECSMPSLWVVPDRLVVRCGNPSCGAERPIHAVLTAYTTGPESSSG